MSKLKVGVIGFGYWGPNLVRNFNSNKECSVTYVSDSREIRLKEANRLYPHVKTTADHNELITSPEVDAVLIATPVFTHFDLAKKALENGKHVLIEKPMTDTVHKAEELIELAEKKKCFLMVDHTYLYTGAVQKIKNIVQSGTIGNIRYIDSIRINLGLFQPDINVLWDLAPHDLSIINYLIDEKPYSINATGISHTSNKIENIGYLTINYQSGLIVHVSSSWSSPVKIRHMLIGGDKQMIVFNDLEPTEKIKVYDSGYDIKNDDEKRDLLIDYRTGDVYIPKLSQKEALFGMAEDFIRCATQGGKPISSASLGLEVVRILENANKSLESKGKEIIL